MADKSDFEMAIDVIKFGFEYDKQELLQNRKGVCIISQGNYKYDIFNFCFVNDILAQILQTLFAGYIPVIDLKDRNPGDSNWSMWFEQPWEGKVNYDSFNIIRPEGRIKTYWGPTYDSPFEDIQKDLACKLYADWLVFNDEIMSYVAEEYQGIIKPFKGRGIMGCLCRGTDFTGTKPKGHPVQPTVEQILDEADRKMMDLSLEKIYLATEEQRILEQFENRFPGRILTNKRNYIDDKYYDAVCMAEGQKVLLEDIKDRSPDTRYEQGLSYLSSIVLLSSCDALVAGNCGGSDAALFFNDNQYRYVNLFNLGKYQ